MFLSDKKYHFSDDISDHISDDKKYDFFDDILLPKVCQNSDGLFDLGSQVRSWDLLRQEFQDRRDIEIKYFQIVRPYAVERYRQKVKFPDFPKIDEKIDPSQKTRCCTSRRRL